MQLLHRYIAIEGNIGAGKSSLATRMSRDFNAKLILEEFEDNSFLPKFYEDPIRYAFPLEMSFLTDRYNQLKIHTPSGDLFAQPTISDYMLAKCLLFSRVNLSDDEYALYHKFFDIIYNQLPHPDLIVYLHNPVEKLQWNIANRGRAYEQQISDDYLLNIQKAYMEYLKLLAERMPVVVIDCTPFDFVKNENDYNNLKSMVCKKYDIGLHHINWLIEE